MVSIVNEEKKKQKKTLLLKVKTTEWTKPAQQYSAGDLSSWHANQRSLNYLALASSSHSFLTAKITFTLFTFSHSFLLFYNAWKLKVSQSQWHHRVNEVGTAVHVGKILTAGV